MIKPKTKRRIDGIKGHNTFFLKIIFDRITIKSHPIAKPIKNSPPLDSSPRVLDKTTKTIPRPRPSIIPPGISNSDSFEKKDQIIKINPSAGRKRTPKIESLKKFASTIKTPAKRSMLLKKAFHNLSFDSSLPPLKVR
ncbi:MAG: hypothetical protein ACPLWB_05045 [Caldisericia bacterium]